MANQPRSKRSPADFCFHRQCADSRRAQVVSERQILELISLGAPLPGILNKLCMMLDVRIGDVVSIVSLADADEGHFCSMAHSALQIGLDTFSCSAILASDRSLLGMLEIFGCDPRRPTLPECQLIDRVAYLASLALQRPEADANLEAPAVKTRGRLDGLLEKTPFIN